MSSSGWRLPKKSKSLRPRITPSTVSSPTSSTHSVSDCADPPDICDSGNESTFLIGMEQIELQEGWTWERVVEDVRVNPHKYAPEQDGLEVGGSVTNEI